MGNVKIKTNSGVKMTAPINTAEELEKVIKFLTAEREALIKTEGKQKKTASSAKDNIVTGFEAARARA